MRIAIIGGSGFIGTRLANRLHNSGVDFIILDVTESKQFPSKYKFCDITDPQSLQESLNSSVDIIINLAAEHQDNVLPIDRYYKVNVTGAKNVCSVSELLGIKYIVFTSSVAVYGFVNEETGEDGLFSPFNDYGKSKLQAEEVYKAWQNKEKNNRALVTIRPTVVFGENNRGNVYNLFKQITSKKFLMIGNGENIKSMAYVENVAAFIQFCLSFETGYHVFNYIDKPNYTMNELLAIIYRTMNIRPPKMRISYKLGLLFGFVFDFLAKIMNKKLPISAIRIKKFCATTQFRSDNILNYDFKPPISLEQGIKETITYEFLS